MQPIKSIFAVLVIFFCTVCCASAARAGAFEDGQAAYDQQDYKTALQLWQPLAEQGNAKAQYNLGMMYDNGFGVRADYRQAVEWFRRAAAQGDKAAERHYEVDNAIWHFGLPKVAQGKPTDKVITAADIRRLTKIEPAAGEAAVQPVQPVQIAPIAPAAKKQPAASDTNDIRKLNALAERGDAEAQLKLGNLYALGKEIPQDYTQAANWYTKAAEQGNPMAGELLGDLYNTGTGVAQNYAEAARLYRLAGDQGNANAEYDLGTLYVLGHGVPQDYEQAAQWYTKAAEQGNAEAQTALGSLYAGGLGVFKDYTQAEKWYKLAAAQGNATARNELDVIHDNKLDAPPKKSPPPAPPKMSLKTQQGFDVGVQISQYHYREQAPGTDPFVNDWGKKLGVEGGYTYVFTDYGVFLRGEGRYAGGAVNYAASNGFDITGIPERVWEVRALEGKDFDLGVSDLSPYTGYAFRHFWDNNGAGSDSAPGGYVRDINYQYMPFGATDRFGLGEQARLATNLEYDLLTGGTVYSGLAEVTPGWTNITNRQTHGSGARGSVLFEMGGWSVGPWFDYWHISQSNLICAEGSCGWNEPNNRTMELGFKVARDFW